MAAAFGQKQSVVPTKFWTSVLPEGSSLLKEWATSSSVSRICTAVMKVMHRPVQDYWPEGEPALMPVGTRK